MLVRPDVVVPGPEFDQLERQLAGVSHRDPVEMPLQRAEEALDATVLLRAVRLGGLQMDIQ